MAKATRRERFYRWLENRAWQLMHWAQDRADTLEDARHGSPGELAKAFMDLMEGQLAEVYRKTPVATIFLSDWSPEEMNADFEKLCGVLNPGEPAGVDAPPGEADPA